MTFERNLILGNLVLGWGGPQRAGAVLWLELGLGPGAGAGLGLGVGLGWGQGWSFATGNCFFDWKLINQFGWVGLGLKVTV